MPLIQELQRTLFNSAESEPNYMPYLAGAATVAAATLVTYCLHRRRNKPKPKLSSDKKMDKLADSFSALRIHNQKNSSPIITAATSRNDIVDLFTTYKGEGDPVAQGQWVNQEPLVNKIMALSPQDKDMLLYIKNSIRLDVTHEPLTQSLNLFNALKRLLGTTPTRQQFHDIMELKNDLPMLDFINRLIYRKNHLSQNAKRVAHDKPIIPIRVKPQL